MLEKMVSEIKSVTCRFACKDGVAAVLVLGDQDVIDISNEEDVNIILGLGLVTSEYGSAVVTYFNIDCKIGDYVNEIKSTGALIPRDANSDQVLSALAQSETLAVIFSNQGTGDHHIRYVDTSEEYRKRVVEFENLARAHNLQFETMNFKEIVNCVKETCS